MTMVCGWTVLSSFLVVVVKVVGSFSSPQKDASKNSFVVRPGCPAGSTSGYEPFLTTRRK